MHVLVLWISHKKNRGFHFPFRKLTNYWLDERRKISRFLIRIHLYNSFEMAITLYWRCQINDFIIYLHVKQSKQFCFQCIICWRFHSYVKNSCAVWLRIRAELRWIHFDLTDWPNLVTGFDYEIGSSTGQLEFMLFKMSGTVCMQALGRLKEWMSFSLAVASGQRDVVFGLGIGYATRNVSLLFT